MIIASSKLHNIIKNLIKEEKEQVCEVEPDKKNIDELLMGLEITDDSFYEFLQKKMLDKNFIEGLKKAIQKENFKQEDFSNLKDKIRNTLMSYSKLNGFKSKASFAVTETRLKKVIRFSLLNESLAPILWTYLVACDDKYDYGDDIGCEIVGEQDYNINQRDPEAVCTHIGRARKDALEYCKNNLSNYLKEYIENSDSLSSLDMQDEISFIVNEITDFVQKVRIKIAVDSSKYKDPGGDYSGSSAAKYASPCIDPFGILKAMFKNETITIDCTENAIFKAGSEDFVYKLGFHEWIHAIDHACGKRLGGKLSEVINKKFADKGLIDKKALDNEESYYSKSKSINPHKWFYAYDTFDEFYNGSSFKFEDFKGQFGENVEDETFAYMASLHNSYNNIHEDSSMSEMFQDLSYLFLDIENSWKELRDLYSSATVSTSGSEMYMYGILFNHKKITELSEDEIALIGVNNIFNTTSFEKFMIEKHGTRYDQVLNKSRYKSRDKDETKVG